jgi:hypothetical protein
VSDHTAGVSLSLILTARQAEQYRTHGQPTSRQRHGVLATPSRAIRARKGTSDRTRPTADLAALHSLPIDSMRRILTRTRTLDALTVLLFGFLALVFVQFAPISGDMAGAVDITTRQTSPYMETQMRFQRSENPLQTDQVDGIALAATFWRGVKSGELRMWEPNLGTGIPLGGVLYTRVWSPFYWVGAVVPASRLSAFAVWLALWSAQAGTWTLARRIGIGRLGSILAGVAYGFSGPTTALLLRVNEAAMAPWVMVATHGVVTAQDKKTAKHVSILALTVAATWLCGFPAAALFVIYGAVAVAIGTAFVSVGTALRSLTTRLTAAAAGIVGGTLLAAPLILPSLQLLSVSEALERSYSSSYAAGFALFGSSVSGRILGSYPLGTWWWPDRGYSNPAEASATVGTVVVVLLVVGAIGIRWVRPHKGACRLIGNVYLPIGAAVFIGTFLGGPVLAALQLLPFMDSNQFGRSRFLLALALALAAGLTLDGLVRPSKRGDSVPGWSFRVLAGGFAVAAIASAIVVLGRASHEGFLDRALSGLGVPIACALIAGAVLAVVPRLRRTAGGSLAIATVLTIALAIELQWGAWEFTPIVDRQEGFFPEAAAYQVMQPAVSDGLYRFAGTSLNVIRPNAGAVLGLADLRVSNPSYGRYRELMRAIDPGVFERARLRTWFTDALDPSSPGLDRSSVLFLVAPASDGILEATIGQEVPVSVDATLAIPASTTAARGLRFEFDETRCHQGFLSVLTEGELIGKRPLWQLTDGPFDVAIEDIDQPAQVEVSVQGCDLIIPRVVTILRARPSSALTLVWAKDAVIYERAGALPRFELATRVEGISDQDRRLDALTDPMYNGVVILDEDQPLSALRGGVVQLLDDDGDHLRLRVVADGPGMLVVRDANAPGWHATVNGRTVPILSADHAFRTVSVPAGTSIVEMKYLPRTRLLGFALAAAAICALIGWAILERRHVPD